MRTVLHSYSFRHYPLEHVLRVARLGGWSAIELSGLHFDARDAEGEIGRAVAAGKEQGVEIYCVGYSADFVSAADADRRRAVERMCRIIDACAAHGVGLINGFCGWLMRDQMSWDDWWLNGSRLASREHYDRAAGAYHKVVAYAANRDVRVAIEVHPHTIHDTVAATARLLRTMDQTLLVVTLDPANAAVVSSQDRDPEVVSPIAERVGYFHLKNCLITNGRLDFTVDAAAGVIDNYRWLDKVTAMPNLDAICVEYCGEGDPHPRVAAARDYLDASLRMIAASRGDPR
jgi:3-dehydroshikimate dehydratase